jgi:hypothetical protein
MDSAPTLTRDRQVIAGANYTLWYRLKTTNTVHVVHLSRIFRKNMRRTCGIGNLETVVRLRGDSPIRRNRRSCYRTARCCAEVVILLVNLVKSNRSFVGEVRQKHHRIVQEILGHDRTVTIVWSTFSTTPLDEAQARRLLEAVRGHRFEVLYRLALSLGLRRGEVCGLRWEDVDFEIATIRITGSIQRYGGKLHRDAPKTNASLRSVALPPVLFKMLKEHKGRQDEERAALTDEWKESGLVFTTHKGTALEPHNVVRHFKTVLKKAELPDTIRFHDLRHSCATLLIAQGVHPRVVMEILGHSQISTTMNTYGHVLPAEK